MNAEQRHLEESAHYTAELDKTKSWKRKKDLRKCIARLEKEMKTYRRLRLHVKH